MHLSEYGLSSPLTTLQTGHHAKNGSVAGEVNGSLDDVAGAWVISST
jgi:hypothetical protein